MKTKRTILKKVDQWKSIPMMITGVYRLFTYLPFNDIPEEYRNFFPKDASEEWDKDLDEYGQKEAKLDIGAEVRAILSTLSKKNITNSLGLVPMLLADLYMLDYNIGTYQGKLAKIISKYSEYVDLDRNLAEQYAIFEIVELLKLIITKANIKLTYNIDTVLEQLIDKYDRGVKDSIEAIAQSQPQDNNNDLNYRELIAEAEAKEAEAKESISKASDEGE